MVDIKIEECRAFIHSSATSCQEKSIPNLRFKGKLLEEKFCGIWGRHVFKQTHVRTRPAIPQLIPAQPSGLTVDSLDNQIVPLLVSTKLLPDIQDQRIHGHLGLERLHLKNEPRKMPTVWLSILYKGELGVGNPSFPHTPLRRTEKKKLTLFIAPSNCGCFRLRQG